MNKFGHAVAKHRIPILIIGVLLLIPSIFGYVNTRINYDMLVYLPESFDTVKGQDILLDDFGKGAFTLIVTEGMEDQDVKTLTESIKEVNHVAAALSYADLADLAIPDDFIPEDIRKNFKNGDDSLIAVFFDSGTSAEVTMEAVSSIRELSDEQVYVSGMSALVTDLKNIAEREEPRYVGMAVLLALVILLLLIDSFLAPFLFLISIGMAIIYNLGSNIFLGEVSYVTKALAAVLQLAVTMDYSIFLWNSYEENRAKYPDPVHAMGEAIGETLVAIFSSACTAISGFLALCFMSYTMGADLGIVMAKGCAMGLLASVTLLPALLLTFNRPLERLQHRKIMPKVDGMAKFVTSKYFIFLIAFVIIAIPAYYGFHNKPVYYDFTSTLSGEDSNLDPEDIPFHTADEKVKEKFDISTTDMVLMKADLEHADAKEMLTRLKAVDGVVYALGYDSVIGGMMPEQMIPERIKEIFKSDEYQLLIVTSEYLPSTDEVNSQCDAIESIVKEYDEEAMLIGEAPATKDLISVTDHDFMVVDTIAIVAILLILLIVFRSLILPFVLVLVIEFAIFVNLGIPFYTDTRMVFLAPVCISTIQLGSTVNYAILLTTRYKRERSNGLDKKGAVSTALSKTFPAVVASAGSFFFATFGVALYSNIGIISQLCDLMSRGALISMLSVLFALPAFLMLLDGAIVKTSMGFRPKRPGKPNKTTEMLSEGNFAKEV